MQLTPSLESLNVNLTDITHHAYETVQRGKHFFAIAHKALSTHIFLGLFPPTQKRTQPLSPEVLAWVQERYNALLETDWQGAERGIYPIDLLFDAPWTEFLQFYPSLWLDSSKMWQRANANMFQEFDAAINLENYPQYYRQNFHYQTDGYLSETSANLYDMQVEILFGGTADAMRRRILAPLVDHVQRNSPSPRILDIACGTGRTLKQLQAAFPTASLFGLDLSESYLRKANTLLIQEAGVLPQLVQGRAEDLPYVENHFDILTCIFLFHELPAPVRQQVIAEAYRVLQPGGMFILCDSIQVADFPGQRVMMDNFANLYHEPFYRNYIEDDISQRLTDDGFELLGVEYHFMSKYWIVRKP
ncbi:class I SAM-dependent methyltransferase [Candidatus Synechococcus calcipolaris G9]|uniref:Class I SAM-dependent methyltransferase n=1 Tax=Candidatus Synechococcus calcipolaris G9 TaxID=1497997 RepID=A0ABT6EWC3_9SYNE|nr:class I SAM-dependent methyltransferase [Candidatus Synechococcus calcipolaris]MDG2990060.1 class I SAM-dependent methyltransferase [Candidatus Synechococcus calcipolaris G9]